MTPALRWEAMRAILMFHYDCEGQGHKTVSTNHNLSEEKGELNRAERLTARPNRPPRKPSTHYLTRLNRSLISLTDRSHWLHEHLDALLLRGSRLWRVVYVCGCLNRRFPEITGEIIRKTETPAVGHRFAHRLLAYIGPRFQNGSG